jgi:PAS domain-containing protein
MIAEQGLANIQNRETTQTAQESEEKFRELVESSSDWIWEVNREGI